MTAIHRTTDGALLAICPVEDHAPVLAASFACPTFCLTASAEQIRALVRESKSTQRAVRLEAIERGRRVAA